MKKRIITICSVIVVLILLVTAILLGVLLPKKNGDSNPADEGDKGGGPTTPVVTPYSVKQTLNYNESIAKIDNPDQGFYYPFIVKIGPEGKISSQDYVLEENKNTYQIFHMRVDISAFSKAINGSEDLELTEQALAYLQEELELFKNANKNIIIRFAYDPSFAGKETNPEPAFDILLKHVEQICNVLNKYEDTITAVEAGLIGSWGEMTSNTTYLGATYTTPLIETFLSNTTKLKILARTPKIIYDYVMATNKQVLLNETIQLNAKTRRLGMYDDSYLSNSADSGTFYSIPDTVNDDGSTIPGTAWNTLRPTHVNFLSQFLANTPFGGEALRPQGVQGDLKNCIPEMFVLHTSYLNGIYDTTIQQLWNNELEIAYQGANADVAVNVKDKFIYNAANMETSDIDELYDGQTGYTYIENHMGYRLVLKDSVFDYTSKYDELTVKLNLKNVGFGNFNKTKNLKLMFVNESGTVVYQNAVGTYNGENNLTLTTNMNLQNGNYKVYLCVYSGELNTPSYCVQFANNGAESWNTTLNANLVGQITINK